MFCVTEEDEEDGGDGFGEDVSDDEEIGGCIPASKVNVASDASKIFFNASNLGFSRSVTRYAIVLDYFQYHPYS